MNRLFVIVYGRIDRLIWRLFNRLRLLRLKMLGVQVGKGVRIYGRVMIVGDPCKLVIGEGSSINEGVILNVRAGVTLGKHVHLSSYAQIHTGSLELHTGEKQHFSAPVIIGDYVWIASGAVVVPGVTIGDGCVIAANSVVTRNLSGAMMAGGAPARIIRALH